MRSSLKRRLASATIGALALASLTSCSGETDNLEAFMPSYCEKLDREAAIASTARDVIRIANENVFELELAIQSDSGDLQSSEAKGIKVAADSLATSLNEISSAFFEESSVSKVDAHERIVSACVEAGISMPNWSAKGPFLLAAGVWDNAKWTAYVQDNMQQVADSLVRYSCSPAEELFDYSPDTSLGDTFYAIVNGQPVFALWLPDDYDKKYRLSMSMQSQGLQLLNCPEADFDNESHAKSFDLKEVIGVLVSQGQV
jgi:hypothetical protein